MTLQKKILKTLAGLAVMAVLLQTVSCGFIHTDGTVLKSGDPSRTVETLEKQIRG